MTAIESYLSGKEKSLLLWHVQVAVTTYESADVMRNGLSKAVNAAHICNGNSSLIGCGELPHPSTRVKTSRGSLNLMDKR